MKFLVCAVAMLAIGLVRGEDPALIADRVAKDHKVTAVDRFYGFDRVCFDFRGYKAWICCPKGEARKDMAWTWVMQWADAYVPRTNVPQLLDAGYHHVTIDTFEHRMDETGLRVSADFQKYLVEKLGFAKKAYLIGMSWGGFFSVRYAAYHPENVAKAYLDAPLLCFKDFSHGVGPWARCAPADGDWMKCPEMPLNLAGRLAKTGIPVLLLYGGHDQTCLPSLNAEPFDRAFREAGGYLHTVKRHLYGHHPHGVEVNENTIKDFFEKPIAGPVLNAAAPTDELVPLGKGGEENAWYALSFSAKGPTDGTWSVNWFDGDRRHIAGAGVNSRFYASEDWRGYDLVVPTPPQAAFARVEFGPSKDLVKDIVLRRIDAEDAFLWCRRFAADLPKSGAAPAKDSWAKLVNSATKIRVDREFRIVFLGDSIMSDTWCGCFGAIVTRDFPGTRIVMYPSIRNATGTWFYHEPANFEQYVARYRPDLVVIGGISNYRAKDMSARQAEDWMVETVERCKRIGAEVAICTPPPNREFRASPEPKPFDASICGENGWESYRWDIHRRAAERSGAALWDMTTGPCEAIARSGRPLGWFKRDPVHNDDRGKQIISTMMSEYFRVVK